MAKEGSTISGLMDTIATMSSLLLQYGVPIEDLARKFGHTRFEPSGFTGNSDVPFASSLPDYVFRYLEARFARGDVCIATQPRSEVRSEPSEPTGAVSQLDAPPCAECGSIMVRNGACHRCPNCGGSSGCG